MLMMKKTPPKKKIKKIFVNDKLCVWLSGRLKILVLQRVKTTSSYIQKKKKLN